MRRAIALLIAGTAAAACGAEPDDREVFPVPAPGKADEQTAGLPMISEYVEGSIGFNKALELFNPLPFAVSMDDCAVQVFSNGRTTPRSIGLLGVVMEPRGTAVVCHPRASMVDGCDVVHGSLDFNGDDAVALTCDFGSGPAVLDVVGIVGQDPGPGGWTAGEGRTIDQTLRRRCSVAAGNDEFQTAQWDAVGRDDVSDLGQHALCSDDGPPPAPACSQGDGVLGAPASAVFSGEDARFEVHTEQTLFDNFTPRSQALLFEAASTFLLDADALTDPASALAGVAREGSGRVERFTIRDTQTGVDYDAVRYFANDATSHSVVVPVGSDERVAFSFDGEFFGCDPSFCSNGDLSRPFYDGLDEDFEPDDRYEILAQETVLAAFGRRARVLRSDDAPTLLTAAMAAHGGGDLTSTEALEQLARANAGPITYYFIAGPTEDLEGIVFHQGDAADHGLLVVEDSLDPELLTRDSEVTFCAPPPG